MFSEEDKIMMDCIGGVFQLCLDVKMTQIQNCDIALVGVLIVQAMEQQREISI